MADLSRLGGSETRLAWERFQAGERLPEALRVRPEVLASWERSARAGAETHLDAPYFTTSREHASIIKALRHSLFLNRDCSSAHTYYIDHHGDAPILRPVTVPRARRESLTFPLDAYRYSTTPAVLPAVPAAEGATR